MAAGAAVAVVGWWTGYKLGGFLALMIADALQQHGFDNYWQITFQSLAVLVLLMNALLLLIPATKPPSAQPSAAVKADPLPGWSVPSLHRLPASFATTA